MVTFRFSLCAPVLNTFWTSRATNDLTFVGAGFRPPFFEPFLFLKAPGFLPDFFAFAYAI
jgi:hypothetical protein